MAEYIEREAAVRTLESVGAPTYAIHALALCQARDVAPVVRCKDCRHNVANWNHDELDGTDYADITCDYFMTDGMNAYDFCSYGERKGGDTK